MILILAGGAGLLALYFMNKSTKSDIENEVIKVDTEVKRLYGIKDVDPIEQGGKFKTDYDDSFLQAANEFNVPFALLKAHGIAESSLKPSAFLDENPTKRADRIGWASRGLMQILWSPREPEKGDAGINRDRWAKYGYPAESLGVDGIRQFEPLINIRIAAQLIRDNLNSTKGNLRDTINMYNTGKTEAQYAAPNNYVDKVLKYYKQLINEVS